MQFSDLFSSDIAVVAALAVAVIFIVIIVLVANKIAAIDNKISILTDDLDKHVDKSLASLGDSLLDDMGARNKHIENSLEHMGESWRDSMSKTVAHLRSEIDQFKSGITARSQEQYELLEEKLTDHAADVSEQLAIVRDTHHQEVHNYHQQLTTQVKEHAAGEQKKLIGSLNKISAAVTSNFGDMVASQNKTLENIARTVCQSHDEIRTALRDDIAAMIKQLSGDVAAMTGKAGSDLVSVIGDTGRVSEQMTNRVGEQLDALVTKVDGNVSGLNTKINSDLAALSDEITSRLESVTGSVDSRLTALTGSIDSNLSSLTSQVVGRISTCTEQLDEDLTALTGKMDRELSGLNSQMSSGIDLISTKVGTDFASVANKLDANVAELGADVATHFSSIEDKIDERIAKEMAELQSIFKGFAGKVSVIEETRVKINELAQNVDILSKVLDDRRSRGALGGLVLQSIVADNLKPGDYEMAARLSNGTEVECLLKLPQPSGNIAISTQIDISALEVIFAPASSNSEIDSARGKFRDKLRDAIDHIADNMIIAGETAEGAVLLLPSENAFAETQIRHRDLINEAYQKRVWLASPSTLIVMVSMARAVIKDATARQEMLLIHEELQSIESDYAELADNVVSVTGQIDALLDSATGTRKAARQLSERFISLNGMFTASDAKSRRAAGSSLPKQQQQH